MSTAAPLEWIFDLRSEVEGDEPSLPGCLQPSGMQVFRVRDVRALHYLQHNGKFEERLTVSQSVSQSGRQAVRQLVDRQAEREVRHLHQSFSQRETHRRRRTVWAVRAPHYQQHNGKFDCLWQGTSKRG